MKRAPRHPSRWAGRTRMLAITAALSAALGACTSMENVFYGAREGTMEYPGSGAGPNAVPTYVAKYNDTVDGIAQRYGVTTQTIVDANRLQPPYPLRAGQTLAVPGAKFVAPAPPTEPATAAPAGPVRRESLAPPGQAEPSRAPPPAGEPTPLSPSSQSVTVQATPPRFDWPLQGKVVAGYGTAAGGQKNDGIDIQAAKGAPVKAADSGTVVYSGNEVRGLGNLLLVSHNSGYITAYANNESLLVKKGDAVKKGQAIAKVGTDSKLHFEVRRGNKTVDPMTVLPGQ